MKLKLCMYAAALMALLFFSCDKTKDDVLPASFQILSLQDDHYGTQANQPVLLAILANDQITGPAQITPGQPQNGVLTAGPEAGQYIYQPDSGFVGTDTFTYTACIGQTCKSAAVTIQVSVVPCTLIARPDADTTNFNTPIIIDVLANDELCDSTQTTISPGITSIRGMFTVLNDNTIEFTPAQGFSGIATFSYRISNGSQTADGVVKITVRQPPTQFCADLVANHDYVSLTTGGGYPMLDLKGMALANDQVCPNYPFTFTLLPTNQYYYGTVHATIVNSDTAIYYIPGHNSQGYETIGYQITQYLPSTEVVSAPAYIYIYLTP